jgi:hypothetical protein
MHTMATAHANLAGRPTRSAAARCTRQNTSKATTSSTPSKIAISTTEAASPCMPAILPSVTAPGHTYRPSAWNAQHEVQKPLNVGPPEPESRPTYLVTGREDQNVRILRRRNVCVIFQEFG